MEEAVAAIHAFIRSEGPHHVVTLNASMLGRAVRDEGFRQIVNNAALVTADGMGTLLLGSILGVRFPERVAGVDLVDRLCEMCAGNGFRVFLYGSAPGVADEAAKRLRERHPGLHIAGSRHGYLETDEALQLVEQIKKNAVDVLLVALGSPKQEEWLARNLSGTGAHVGIGVGGSLDVYSGRLSLAPRWIRGIGMEWLYRIVKEPRRWRAVVPVPGIFMAALKERISRRWKRTQNRVEETSDGR